VSAEFAGLARLAGLVEHAEFLTLPLFVYDTV
jgi:hypothetical protein